MTISVGDKIAGATVVSAAMKPFGGFGSRLFGVIEVEDGGKRNAIRLPYTAALSPDSSQMAEIERHVRQWAYHDQGQ